ncbi:MAG: transglycosylase SLT domain-containing protein [Gammaproteobacteria bacterium]|nr:transglycosylase SLT domain-containing protein [Gammaproteobacteria bacterium]
MDTCRVHKLCLFAVLASAFVVGTAQAEVRDEQRRMFQSARHALKQQDMRAYQRLEPALREYPLYPYLRYEVLRSRLGRLPADEVRTFLDEYPDTPLADQLRRAWLAHLFGQRRWLDFERDYVPGLGTAYQCQFLFARLQNGAGEALWSEMDALWLTGVSLPDECDAPIAAWRKDGQLTREKVLARIELAMQRGQAGLVRYLTGLLPKSDSYWVQRWHRVQRSPATEIDRLKAETEPAWTARLFNYGMRRLAERDADAAARRFARHIDFELTVDQVLAIERTIALGMALQRHPDAVQWLTRVAAVLPQDRDVREWRIRAALWQQDWNAVLTAIAAVPNEERESEEWQYWTGRALEALGHKDAAQRHYANAAQERAFHGFLAAARLGEPPNIATVPVGVTDQALEALRLAPAMVRVRELQAVGMDVQSRREWREALARLDEDGLQVAAKLAHEWGWFDQAIIALGKTRERRDLELRFPTPYQEEVLAAATKRGVDPAFIFAVMRQESAFGAEARSRVGALGLMQLMPATARQTARVHKLPLRSRADILKADTNIRLGTAHLSDLLERYEGNRVFVLAAYNAGPRRVERWRPDHVPVPADIWVANITFGETREYVQRILTYTAIYEWRLGRDITPLDAWLHTVEPRYIREAGQLESAHPPG